MITQSQDVQDAIRELQYDYVQCIDDDRLEEWPEFFTDDCLYKIVSRESYDKDLPASIIYCESKGMLEDRITAHRNANIYEPHYYRHMISNIRVVGEENGIYSVQSNYAVFQTRLNGGDTELYNVGRYLDKVIIENDEPKFTEKIVVSDTLRIPTLLVTPI